MSRGRVRQVEWEYEGKTRKAWGYTVTIDGKRVRRAGFGSRAEATEALDLLLHPEPVVAAPARVGLTLAAAFEKFFTAKARKQSLDEDRRIAKHLIEFFGADLPLADLTSARIAGYRDSRLAITKSRRGGPLSAAAINRPLQCLRTMLRLAAEEWEALDGASRIRLEKEPQGRIRWLERDEEHRLLEACGRSANKGLQAIVTVALETGLRQGELLDLDWERVDLTRGVLKLEITKSGRRREVPMRQVVYDILSQLPGLREGRVWPAGSIRTAWEGAVERAKLEDFHFHDTRHHFASWFMMRGGSLLALKEILGHASLAMTQRYAHLSPGHLKAEIAKTEGQGRSRAEEMVESAVRLVR